MRYVVGYVPNQRGVDAVKLAATLAASRTATLDIVVVLPVETVTFDMYSPDRAYFAQLEKWAIHFIATRSSLRPGDLQ